MKAFIVTNIIAELFATQDAISVWRSIQNCIVSLFCHSQLTGQQLRGGGGKSFVIFAYTKIGAYSWNAEV